MRSTRFRSLVVVGLLAGAAPSSTALAQYEFIPDGPHYDLTLFGMPAGSTDMPGVSGRWIVVRLGGDDPANPVETQITLLQSATDRFYVTDNDGRDGAAIFQLPSYGTYSLWVRPGAQPDSASPVAGCAEDPDVEDPTPSDVLCPTYSDVVVREGESGRFMDVTHELTTILLGESSPALQACGGVASVSLFNPCLEGYFWDRDSHGLRRVQLRLYYEP